MPSFALKTAPELHPVVLPSFYPTASINNNNKKTSLMSFDSLFVPIGCKWCFYNLQLCTHQDVLNASIEVKFFCTVIEQILWGLFSEGGVFSEICIFAMSLLSFIFTEGKLP